MADTIPSADAARPVRRRRRAGSPTRVVVVCAYYDKSSGYVENVLAEGLARRAKVSVITSTLPTPGLASSAGADHAGWRQEGNVLVRRLRPLIDVRTRVFARGVQQAMAEARPDLIVQLSPSQGLPLAASAYAKATNTPLIYMSGEHSEQIPARGVAKWASLGYRALVLRQIQRYCGRRAEVCVGATPATADDLRRVVDSSTPTLCVRLPYDQQVFAYSPARRRELRDERGWTGLVTLYAGKFDGRKNLVSMIDWWERVFADDETARLVLVGDQQERPDGEARRIRHRAQSAGHRVKVFPFMTPRALSDLMNACDVAVFPNASIGIFQALGTGLSVVVPRVPALSGLDNPETPESVFSYEVGAAQSWEGCSAALLKDSRVAAALSRDEALVLDDARRSLRARGSSLYAVSSVVDRFLGVAEA